MFRASHHKYIKSLKTFVCLLLLFGGMACSNRSWTKLSPKEVREILPELSLLKAYLHTQNVPDSIRYVSYYAFFQKHGITQTDWDSTMFWYAKHDIHLYHNFYSRLDDSIRRLQIKLQKKVDKQDEAERRRYDWENGRLENANLLLDTIYPKFLTLPTFVNETFVYKPRIYYDSLVQVSVNLGIQGLGALEQDSLFMSFALFSNGKLDTMERQTIKENGIHKLVLSAKRGRIDSIRASLCGFVSKSNALGLVAIDSLSLIRLPKKLKENL